MPGELAYEKLFSERSLEKKKNPSCSRVKAAVADVLLFRKRLLTSQSLADRSSSRFVYKDGTVAGLPSVAQPMRSVRQTLKVTKLPNRQQREGKRGLSTGRTCACEHH